MLMKLKRILAYILDYIIVSFIASLLFMTPPFQKSFKTYEKNYEEYTSTMVEMMSSDSEEYDEERLIEVQYDLNKASSSLLILNIGTLFFYFGVFAFLTKGQTLGKKIMKIRVVSVKRENLNPFLFIMRSMIVTNLLFETIRLLFLLFGSKSSWVTATFYIGYLSYFVYFILLLFMIVRGDERSLHDLLCDTKVVSTKVKEN